jgi:hypothetical protein
MKLLSVAGRAALNLAMGESIEWENEGGHVRPRFSKTDIILVCMALATSIIGLGGACWIAYWH